MADPKLTTTDTATDAELLALSVRIAGRTHKRGLVRSGNGITGDYAEKVVADTLGLKLANASAAAYDALGADGTRYQIKARRMNATGRGTRQLSAIRNLDDNGFDQLIAVLFDRLYKVSHVYVIPPEVVRRPSSLEQPRQRTPARAVQRGAGRSAHPGHQRTLHGCRLAMSKHNLKVKDSRRRLKPRREPYWMDLGKGCAIGFRRGPDSWIARWHNPADKKHHYLALKEALEFEDALEAAQTWWRTVSGGASGSVVRGTVLEALTAYVKAKREHGRDADDIERRIGLTVEGTGLASTRMEQLTLPTFTAWRTSLMPGRANRTVNREVRCIVAGLNWAVKRGGYSGNPLAWSVDALADDLEDEADRAAVFLNPEQRASLIEALHEHPDAQAFLRGLQFTGARPGELAAATVADFDGARLTLRSRKGKSGKLKVRSIDLSSEGVEFFKAQAKGKTPAAPLFVDKLTGAAWVGYRWAKAIRYGIEQANKRLKGKARIPVTASAYSFRHASISELLPVLDPVTVAKHHGTSVAMIERTYFKHIPGSVRAALDGLKANGTNGAAK